MEFVYAVYSYARMLDSHSDELEYFGSEESAVKFFEHQLKEIPVLEDVEEPRHGFGVPQMFPKGTAVLRVAKGVTGGVIATLFSSRTHFTLRIIKIPVHL